MKRASTMAFFMAILLSISCSDFKIVDNQFNVKGKKIAVVSGLNKAENLAYATMLTAALKKYSTLDVISQDEIRKSVAYYPYRIKGPYFAYLGIDADYSRTSLKQIENLQKKLKVDFIYVIWTPTTYRDMDGGNTLCTIGQIFAFPGCREIARSRYDIEWSVKWQILRNEPGGPEKPMMEMSEKSAADIAEKLNVKRGNAVK